MNRKALATLCAALSFAASSASAQLITFDDLNPGINDIVLTNYAGLNWNNFNVFNPSLFYDPSGPGGSGFLNGTKSPYNIAYNPAFDENGDPITGPATISSPTGFNLVDGYFTGAWNDGLQIHAVATSGVNTFIKDFTVNSASPTDIVFNWNNISSVSFTSSGGTPAFGSDNGTHFALDNLTVTAVPEPEEWAMLMVGVPLIGWKIRRKQGS
jgi:hypothetical protein